MALKTADRFERRVLSFFIELAARNPPCVSHLNSAFPHQCLLPLSWSNSTELNSGISAILLSFKFIQWPRQTYRGILYEAPTGDLLLRHDEMQQGPELFE